VVSCWPSSLSRSSLSFLLVPAVAVLMVLLCL
jgi:hypothetical protein